MGRMDGRVAVVTGASRGLGKAIALAFAAEGAAVAVVARTEAQWDPRLPGTVHDTAAEITAAGGRAVAVPADLSDQGQVDTVIERARALGPISILVNNAALTVSGRPPADGAAPVPASRAPAPAPAPPASGPGWPSFLTFPLKGLRLHLEVGLFAAYRLMQLALPDMVAAGGGAIVNISSGAGLAPGEGPYPNPGPGPLAYGASKAALQHLSQSVAAEMQPHGIAVNVLIPSEPVATPGSLAAGIGDAELASADDFAEAALRVALADPAKVNGQLLWHADVLHPELGQRGWLR